MISFTKEELVEIRRRSDANPVFLNALKEECAPFFEPYEVQKKGIANWTLYYVCPVHSVGLIYNRHDPYHHKCPIDGAIYSGGNYDTAWWGETTYRQGYACLNLSLVYMITEDLKYLEAAKKLFLEFAKYYKGYEVHGDIPYNKPGKAMAQVLDDASFLNYLGRGYDIIRDELTEEEQKAIEENIFRPGAEHLMKYRTPQIHNHEMIVNAALGILGILLDDEEILSFGIESKYGMKYQFDYAVSKDGLWFEGSSGYHFFALRWAFFYDSFARHTKYCLTKDPHYGQIIQKMILFPRCFLTPSGYFPAINDCHVENFHGEERIYEYAYSTFRTPEVLDLLHRTVDGTDRSTIYALLYGVEDLPPVDKYESKTFFAKEGSHVSVIYGTEMRFLLMKNMPYGGEHDHYDRLAISLEAFDRPLVSDIGTSAYGAPLHYAYYKNTASHNTVCFNGKNMPPVEVQVTDFTEKAKDDVRIDANIDFSREFTMPDSFTIKAWDNEVYENAKMRRVIRWFDKYLVDFFFVEGKEGIDKDYTLHFLANPLLSAEDVVPLRDEGPQSIIKGKFRTSKEGIYHTTYQKEDYEIHVFGEDTHRSVFDGFAPNCPSTSDIAYLVERATEGKVVFAHVIEMCKQGASVIQNVSIKESEDQIQVIVQEKNGRENIVIESK